MPRSRENPASARELWRTSLCRHGPRHGIRHSECRFAHSLLELRGPDESRVSYAAQWRQCTMDRFYGQRMTDEQLERIRSYYAELPRCDLPLWAIGLRLIASNEESIMGFAYPWDFGLTRDYDDLLAARHDRRRPFEPWPELWERLNRRRGILLAYEHPPHALGLSIPSGPETYAPVRSASEPIVAPEDGCRLRSRSTRSSSCTSSRRAIQRRGSPGRGIEPSSVSEPMVAPVRGSRSRSMRSSSSSSSAIRRRGPPSRGLAIPDDEDL